MVSVKQETIEWTEYRVAAEEDAPGPSYTRNRFVWHYGMKREENMINRLNQLLNAVYIQANDLLKDENGKISAFALFGYILLVVIAGIVAWGFLSGTIQEYMEVLEDIKDGNIGIAAGMNVDLN